LDSDNEYKLVSFTRYPFKFSEFEKDIQLLIQCEDNDRDLISDFLKLINDEKFISLNNQYKILKYNKIDFLSYSKKYTLSIKFGKKYLKYQNELIHKKFDMLKKIPSQFRDE
jgi:hypothetical protein